MTRPRSTDTRDRIQAVAVDLFMAQGVQKTSLREIADQLGMTKAALYYHFPSKEALVRSLVDPFLEDVEALLADTEAKGDVPPRQFLEAYFDVFFRHRRVIQLMIRDLSAIAHLGLEQKLVGWQVRLRHLLVGRDASPADQVRAVFALGGLQDVAGLLTAVPADRPYALLEIPAELSKRTAVETACAALGLTEDAEATPRA